MKLELTVVRAGNFAKQHPTFASEDDFIVTTKNEETGEIREVVRPTVESAMRTLGNTIDRDFKLDEEHKRFLDTNN